MTAVLMCALGTLVRFGFSELFSSHLFVATVVVNIAGCVIAGFAVSQGVSAAYALSFCGGLTTASGFAGDTFLLYERKGIFFAVAVVVGHVGLAMASFALGLIAGGGI